jgi:hypothetical protein
MGQPEGWFKIGSPTLTPFLPGGAQAGAGNKICKAVLAPTEGFGQYLGVITAGGAGGLVNEDTLVGLVKGSKVCAAVDAMMDATSACPEITLVLGYHDGTAADYDVELVVNPLTDELHRFTTYHEIPTDAKQVYFKVFNDTGDVATAYFSNAMFHVGEFPLMYRPSGGWRMERWDFGVSGAAAEANLPVHGVANGKYQVDPDASGYIIAKAAAIAYTAPSGGDTVFQVVVDSTDGLVITIPDGVTSGVVDLAEFTEAAGVELNENLAAKCTDPGLGSAAEDVVLSVWGFYYGL